ncbi:substrate-binding periplasmic protein [Paramagnetospirillum magnetotacticum]|nr:transporter substrate-binding domain-containing protein [Paramagnetospirillum magnetotacticum]
MRSSVLILLFLAAVTTRGAFAAAETSDSVGPAVIVAAFNDAPPMAYTTAKGRLDGALYRVSRSLFAAAGIPWKGASYPAPRLVKGLQDGSFNFSMLVRMPFLDECCLVSSEPVIVQEPRVYFLGGTAPVARKEDLAGHSLIVVNGYTYAGMISYFRDPANRVELEVAENLDSAFRMLAAGRAEYLLSYEANARDSLSYRPIATLDSRVIGRTPVYLVLSKTYPDAAATMARLEKLVKAMNIRALMAGD